MTRTAGTASHSSTALRYVPLEGVVHDARREVFEAGLELLPVGAVMFTSGALTTLQGARDYALLATMFNTGGRVQEIVDLRVRDLQLIKPFQVRLFGKGKKERYCPLWPETAAVLRSFCKQRKIEFSPGDHLFVSSVASP